MKFQNVKIFLDHIRFKKLLYNWDELSASQIWDESEIKLNILEKSWIRNSFFYPNDINEEKNTLKWYCFEHI